MTLTKWACAVAAWWVLFEDRDPGCVLAPDAEEALCIAEEETGARPRTVEALGQAVFPLLNCPGTLQRGGMVRRCLPSQAMGCQQDCPLRPA